MKVLFTKWLPVIVFLTAIALLIFVKSEEINRKHKEDIKTKEENKLIKDDGEREEKEAAFIEDRTRYDFDMLKDPVTGKIPAGIFEKEILFARSLPVKGEQFSFTPASRVAQTTALNNYYPAGPNNIGGRTRALAYDVRYDGNTNKVIIAGCVSGGILRSTDGGNTWARVTPERDVHSFSAIVQDTRNGFQDTWYAGGGEGYGNSANEVGAPYLGYGLWKSTNNGETWTKLPLTAITEINGAVLTPNPSTLEDFDHPFDFVHKIAVHPTTGDVYVAGHRRLLRSTDGGQSFKAVFASLTSTAANSETGQMDVTIGSDGRILLAVNGANPDQALRGVWISGTGNTGSFSRLAGGKTLGVDSVAGWRANSYNADAKRILIAQAPSNPNTAYVLYENGLSGNPPEFNPEADLFRMEITVNVNVITVNWSNRSANMPDFPGNLAGSDPFAVQNGYNMLLKVKPNDPNTVFVGGTNLYRSTDGFATNSNTAWINGYSTKLNYSAYPNGHADIHSLTFHPTDANQAICGDDGGIRLTSDISAATVNWNPLPNYQTLQYYYVAIDPDENRNNFAGGSQDNGVLLRDKARILGTPVQDSNNHIRLNGGDGCAVGISKLNLSTETQFIYGGSQRGSILRIQLSPARADSSIRPNNLTTSNVGSVGEYGEFVTNFRLNPDNTENLYYVNFNRLFRTGSASTVTSSTWTELTGVGQAVNPAAPTNGRNISIRALAFSRGTYAPTHSLYLGTTNGKIFRLDDPRNAAAGTVPVNITPSGLTGNVQDISVNPDNDNEILAIVSNYGAINIWWTDNAKTATPTWKNAEGNLTLPSIRSCAIVIKKDTSGASFTEYYVGTSVGLYSTTGLATAASPVWQREGGSMLNYAIVQSMAYRPSDNVLLVGTHGNGLYYSFLGKTGVPTDPNGTFITEIDLSVTRGSVGYKVGNLNIQKMFLRLFTMQGQLLIKEEREFTNGTVSLRPYAAGMYILSFISDDGRHKFTHKVIKQ